MRVDGYAEKGCVLCFILSWSMQLVAFGVSLFFSAFLKGNGRLGNDVTRIWREI
jgi:hypothetical protein